MAAKMTRQHFKIVAAAVSEAVNYLENEAERRLARQVVWTVTQFIAAEMSKTNPGFSYVRFYKACGLCK